MSRAKEYVTSYVSGYEIEGVMYLNADQMQVVLLKGGYVTAAAMVEQAVEAVREALKKR